MPAKTYGLPLGAGQLQTWLPRVYQNGYVPIDFSHSSGYFITIGEWCFVNARITMNGSGGAGSRIYITDMPFRTPLMDPDDRVTGTNYNRIPIGIGFYLRPGTAAYASLGCETEHDGDFGPQPGYEFALSIGQTGFMGSDVNFGIAVGQVCGLNLSYPIIG